MKSLTEKELLNINGGKKKNQKVSTTTTSYSWGVSSSNNHKICKGSGNGERCRKVE
ncbi:hypothetical protein [Sporomusa silvacetica]|uniref:hypothetical protein n=1 Tax=Sporomusa silvacetica TaxID=55504 RepID=UPI00146CFCE9|nr:hypothetical protein [Sporomusa silvacetica]